MFHTLDLWVDNLLQYPKVNISLRGFCEDTYSRSLAEEMAQAVKNYLIYKGIDAQRIAVYGSTSPTDANASAALNDYRRRVEFAIEN